MKNTVFTMPDRKAEPGRMDYLRETDGCGWLNWISVVGYLLVGAALYVAASQLLQVAKSLNLPHVGN